MTIDLLCLGEAMAEIRSPQTDDYSLSFAGDTLNTAIYAKRMMQDGTVAYVTRIGTDALSASFRRFVEREEIDTRHFETDGKRNVGIYAVTTDDSGERSFSYWRASSAARQLFADDHEIALPMARIIYLSGISMAILPPHARQRLIEALRRAQNDNAALIAFDSNYRPALWEDAETARDVIRAMWELADIALPSIDDEMALFNESSEQQVIDRFSSRAWHACAIKRGAKGPVSPSLPDKSHPEFLVEDHVIDTTAAGDSFNGAYLASLLNGDDEITRLNKAHKLAAKVIGHPGAIIPAGSA